MKANVTITVSHDGTAKALVATVGQIADKEFNNAVRPPEKPKFRKIYLFLEIRQQY